MRRLHLIEFEDQAWFPPTVRRYGVDFLAFMGNLDPDSYRPFVEKLKVAMERMDERQLLDLCSGGAGPVAMIVRTLEQLGYPARATLTDLYPNPDSFLRWADESGGRIDWRAEPVDAATVPPELPGFRLLCNAFHHFRPEMARRILESAARDGRGIGVVEVVGRSPAALLSIPLLLLVLLLVTPFLKPFRLSRLLFTYVLPLVPLLVLWDGFVSCLRVYSPAELAELTRGIDHHWEYGRLRVPRTPLKLTYLIGRPRAR